VTAVTVLTGGVGGAKLVAGLVDLLGGERVRAIVNVGDDFEHLGLAISPDIDTLLYTLSGRASIERGWGREDESWHFMAALSEIGGPDWFALGDRDLALHVLRTEALRRGEGLAAIVGRLARAFGIAATLLPASEHAVRTIIETDEGALAFQRYFVERRCAPKVRAITFAGASVAEPAPGVLDALCGPDTAAILLAPSNPYLSIDPILAIPAIRAAVARARAPVVAVSPLVGGDAVKGPTAKMMDELGVPRTAASIARHYAGIIGGLLVDARDPVVPLDIPCDRADTLMHDDADRRRVAAAAMALAGRLR
jgi:LPPG:FO 2-phospho-L-lactate transferase